MTPAHLFPTAPPDETSLEPARPRGSTVAPGRTPSTASEVVATPAPVRDRQDVDAVPPSKSGRSAPAARRRNSGRRHDERGEGVISAAIAVLIMAFLGVGMWVAFNTTFQHTANNVDKQVNTCIGQTNPNC